MYKRSFFSIILGIINSQTAGNVVFEYFLQVFDSTELIIFDRNT